MTTTQLFTLLAGLLRRSSLVDRLRLRHTSCSLEIVSRKETGIRYVLRIPRFSADTVEKGLRAYIPGLQIKETADYIPKKIPSRQTLKIVELRQARHFCYPLNISEKLDKHDPLAYLTGNMTQLEPDDMLAMQLVLRPLNGGEERRIRQEIQRVALLLRKNQMVPCTSLQRSGLILAALIEYAVRIAMIPLLFLAEFVSGQAPAPVFDKQAGSTETSSGNKELETLAKTKLGQPLFATSMRVLIVASNRKQSVARRQGIGASFAGFTHTCGQALVAKRASLLPFFGRLHQWQYWQRLGGTPLIITAAEVGALYHFPVSERTTAEDLVRLPSRELPAPLVLKNTRNLDVVFGQNTYGNAMTKIGLTDDDRSRHMYLIGQTGSGKSTIIYHMASDDIRKGRGVAVVDPHGDLAEDLLSSVPADRMNDLIYFNPFDVKYPIGINLLELSPCTDEDDLELEKELVCESVISIFRRVFSKDENADAHRIEYILRNTIYTAFTVPDSTIFTIYDLLNDPEFQKKAVKGLTDENLLHFWRNEFGRAGNYQIVKMVGGVTAKVGRFLFSPTAKRILEQPKSTVNFDEIFESGKILICNLAEGKIGEDTSQLLGTTVIAKIQQATMRRARSEGGTRAPFYLFIDELQNFATSLFTKLLSSGRKFGLRITIAEQSTAQQSDRNTVNVILANTGTMVCFRTASPVDENLMLTQFAPLVERGDISNLPRYRFYMKMAAVKPEEPFTGETLPMAVNRNPEEINRLITASRQNFAILYQRPTAPKVQTKPVKTKGGPAEEPDPVLPKADPDVLF